MSKLKGKVAVAIGGSTGIGLASAKEFINEGAKVVLFARSKKDLDAAVKELGSNSHAVVGDVTKLADLDKLYAETKSKFGGVDVLFINSAQGKLVPIAETTEAIYDEMLNVNLKGSYFAFQKAIAYLNKGASVILTTSWINEIGFGGTSLLLMRARNDLYNWMNKRCGLVNEANPCRCARKTKGYIKAGIVDPENLKFNVRYKQRILELSNKDAKAISETVEDLNKRVFQSHPLQLPLTKNRIVDEVVNNKLIKSLFNKLV